MSEDSGMLTSENKLPMYAQIIIRMFSVFFTVVTFYYVIDAIKSID
jgi:hypothetical protein